MHQNARGYGNPKRPRRGRTTAPDRLKESARLAVVEGKFDVAEAAYREMVARGTRDPDVYNNLAAIGDRKGTPLEAQIELLEKALDLAPGNEEFRNNLRRVLGRQRAKLVREGHFELAVPSARRLVELEPNSAGNHRELGDCLAKSGDLAGAVKEFTRAINLEPNNASHYNDLGLACFELRWLAEAQGAFQEVLRLKPQSPVAFTHLGLLANITGLSGVAVSLLERAVTADPRCSAAHSNLGLFLRDQGDLHEARKHLQEALRLNPKSLSAMSSYLLLLAGDPEADPAWVGQEHKRYDAIVRGTVRRVVPRDWSPTRPLRIGYLSPDMRAHSVAFFFLPLLEKRDREAFHVTCYSTTLAEDDVTRMIRANSDAFRAVYRMSDEKLATQIQDDGIDILVELSGHTANNRLPMLANRVAPVQVTYLGYANTTGLAEMDYRITDEIADPVGVSDSWHTEKLMRMPGGFLAYRPFWNESALPVEPMPAEKSGHISFGSFNNLAKLNDLVLDTWAAILAQVPNSELLLKAKGLRSDKVQSRIMAAFAARGVGKERVRLLTQEHSSEAHLALYHQMDIALDTFPYNGTTTTCEALWMGTPVVTFEGRSHAGRVGATLLHRVGLRELVAADRLGYIETAVALAKDRTWLSALRTGLRGRLLQSPAADAKRMAREIEAGYREMWQRYCAGGP